MKKTFELDGSDDTLGTQVFEIAPPRPLLDPQGVSPRRLGLLD
jgi:hypothetical protein